MTDLFKHVQICDLTESIEYTFQQKYFESDLKNTFMKLEFRFVYWPIQRYKRIHHFVWSSYYILLGKLHIQHPGIFLTEIINWPVTLWNLLAPHEYGESSICDTPHLNIFWQPRWFIYLILLFQIYFKHRPVHDATWDFSPQICCQLKLCKILFKCSHFINCLILLRFCTVPGSCVPSFKITSRFHEISLIFLNHVWDWQLVIIVPADDLGTMQITQIILTITV